jgi:MoxR-like ATPase
VQFTPDLMPSDILGTSVFDITNGQFHLRKGPIFTQILLADEINRAPAKTQSALLEAMEERQVNLDGTRYPLEKTEVEVMRRYHQGFDPHDLSSAGLTPFLASADVGQIRQSIKSLLVEDGILTYIARVAEASRRSPDISLGASTRAATWILLAAKTYAALQGRDFVTPDDVKFVVPPVLRHRLLLRPEAEIEGLNADAVIQRLLGQVEVPR